MTNLRRRLDELEAAARDVELAARLRRLTVGELLAARAWLWARVHGRPDALDDSARREGEAALRKMRGA